MASKNTKSLRKILNNFVKANPKYTELTRYYHNDTCGRALMGSTKEVPPPKHVFGYYYIPDTYPDQLGGFRVPKRDQFCIQHLFSYETWEYKYHGQQWHIGSLFTNLMYLLLPFIIYVIRSVEDQKVTARRGTGSRNYTTQGGYHFNQIYDNYDDIIQEDD